MAIPATIEVGGGPGKLCSGDFANFALSRYQRIQDEPKIRTALMMRSAIET
jgi:hypothetical protein